MRKGASVWQRIFKRRPKAHHNRQQSQETVILGGSQISHTPNYGLYTMPLGHPSQENADNLITQTMHQGQRGRVKFQIEGDNVKKGKEAKERGRSNNKAKDKRNKKLKYTVAYEDDLAMLPDRLHNVQTEGSIYSSTTMPQAVDAPTSPSEDHSNDLYTITSFNSITQMPSYQLSSTSHGNKLIPVLVPKRRCSCKVFASPDNSWKEEGKKYRLLPKEHPIFNELMMESKVKASNCLIGQTLACISLIYIFVITIILIVSVFLGRLLYIQLVHNFELSSILPNCDYAIDIGKLFRLKGLEAPNFISATYGQFTGLASFDLYHCAHAPKESTSIFSAPEHRTVTYLLTFSTDVTETQFTLGGNGPPYNIRFNIDTKSSRHFPFSGNICIKRTYRPEETTDSFDSNMAVQLSFEQCVTLQYILENKTTTDFRNIFHCQSQLGCIYTVYLKMDHTYRNMSLVLQMTVDFPDISSHGCKYVGVGPSTMFEPKDNNFLLVKRKCGSNIAHDTVSIRFHYSIHSFVLSISILILCAIGCIALFIYIMTIIRSHYYLQTINSVLDAFTKRERFKKRVADVRLAS